MTATFRTISCHFKSDQINSHQCMPCRVMSCVMFDPFSTWLVTYWKQKSSCFAISHSFTLFPTTQCLVPVRVHAMYCNALFVSCRGRDWCQRHCGRQCQCGRGRGRGRGRHRVCGCGVRKCGCGCVGVWVCVWVGVWVWVWVWVCGCVGVWVRGCGCGCAGVWVCVGVCVFAFAFACAIAYACVFVFVSMFVFCICNVKVPVFVLWCNGRLVAPFSRDSDTAAVTSRGNQYAQCSVYTAAVPCCLLSAECSRCKGCAWWLTCFRHVDRTSCHPPWQSDACGSRARPRQVAGVAGRDSSPRASVTTHRRKSGHASGDPTQSAFGSFLCAFVSPSP